MKKADVQEAVRTAVNGLHEKAKSYDEQARTARYSNDVKDASYNEGVAQGYRLAAIDLDSKLEALTR